MEAENKLFYANGLEVAVSPFDFNLKFIRQGAGENAQLGVVSAPTRLDEFTIAMSPQHAKAMMAGLYQAVVQYESSIAPIKLPADLENQYQQTFGSLVIKK